MKSHVGGSHSQTNFMTYGILGGTSADFKIEVDSDYHFRVRVVTNDGYRGAWSQEYHTLSSGTVYWTYFKGEQRNGLNIYRRCSDFNFLW